MIVRCVNCGRLYPQNGFEYRCLKCGGVYDIPILDSFNIANLDNSEPGIWKFKHTFGTPLGQYELSLGEGGTPLVWFEAFKREIAVKCEYLNPTGSFKDRGSSVLVSFLRSRDIKTAFEDSSGNAGASFAAYAARAGLSAKVFIPDDASELKKKQISMYGADLIRIMGPRSNASKAAEREAENGGVYASHAYLPFNLVGYATLAYELVAQLEKSPGTVILPVGQGGLFLGLARGFDNLLRSGVITKMPKLVGVQALACAPLWAIYSYGNAGLRLSGVTNTVAEGIRIRYPIRGDEIIRLCKDTNSELMAVDEEFILSGHSKLARNGFYVEPTSAVVWEALEKGISRWSDPIVLILTGSGLKSA